MGWSHYDEIKAHHHSTERGFGHSSRRGRPMCRPAWQRTKKSKRETGPEKIFRERGWDRMQFDPSAASRRSQLPRLIKCKATNLHRIRVAQLAGPTKKVAECILSGSDPFPFQPLINSRSVIPADCGRWSPHCCKVPQTSFHDRPSRPAGSRDPAGSHQSGRSNGRPHQRGRTEQCRPL
ncbi:hypothetical protein V6x_37490 [Gimesia chilikensis]|uniref:Uncharacterized protein n=1 Tax=Gimesia chilikensis TaxID=2605989 RepID=A0A517WFL1_9PLAN|nr:hypothetical protein V6x_37490 [Gimesia chilikensis]